MSKTITLTSGVKLNYEISGSGVALLCVPGWAYSTEVFARNLPELSKHYQVYSIDPRSHGQSDVCNDGNNYEQHGRDLKEFIQGLQLKEFILLGWSLGVYSIYSYLQQFGFEGVKALIAVDESPRIIKASDNDWGEGSAEEISGLIEVVRSDSYLDFFRDYMAEGFVQQPDDELLDRFTQLASSLTPEVAADLLQDATQHDFVDIATNVALQVPVLNILREDWATEARSWIEKHQPTAETKVLGRHLMLYELADEFNSCVLNFLTRHC